MMASSSSPQTTTFFGFVVPLLCNPQAFPQHLVPSNLSKLCTEQDNVKEGIRHELLAMLQGQTDQASMTKLCRQVVSMYFQQAGRGRVSDEATAFWTQYLLEIIQFDDDPDDWADNWSHARSTWQLLAKVFTTEDGWKYAVLFGRLSKSLVHLSNYLPEHHLYPGDTSLLRRTALEPVTLAFRTALKNASEDSSSSSSTNNGSPFPQPRRTSALLGLAISLFRISFILEKPQLCPQIMQLVGPHLASFGESHGGTNVSGKMSVFGMADVVEFRYVVGQWHLGRRAIRDAHKEFRIAFDLCSTNASLQNRRSILIRLLTTSLLLGLLPSPALVDAFDLSAQFSPLVQGIQHGDMHSWRAGLGINSLEGNVDETGRGRDRAEWFRQRGILGVLREKGEVLVWRGLLRRTLLIHRQLAARTAAANGTTLPQVSSLPISKFLAALKFSMEDDWLELDDAEAICVSLIDQGFLKAYIGHASRTLVFSKDADLGFPAVAKVRGMAKTI